MTEELRNLYALLDVYKEKLAEAIDNNDQVMIKHWQDNIRGLENKIAGLE